MNVVEQNVFCAIEMKKFSKMISWDVSFYNSSKTQTNWKTLSTPRIRFEKADLIQNVFLQNDFFLKKSTFLFLNFKSEEDISLLIVFLYN